MPIIPPSYHPSRRKGTAPPSIIRTEPYLTHTLPSPAKQR